MQTVIHYSNQLRDLRAIFIDAGFDLWLVGGCVRDSIMGIAPKDIDIATSATPDEQIAIYNANSIRFIPTGLQHGTVSVVLDDTYEITSLRTESDHDGRWASVAFTRDLNEDLSRRDLTINAIAMDFDGNIIDPFGGVADIEARRVRFVGAAEERMTEDYLRILRFFRFHARIAGDARLDTDAVNAIKETRSGLAGISAERIWSEISKIITGPSAPAIVSAMRELTIFEIIDMPHGMIGGIMRAQVHGITDPASVMGLYVIEPDEIDVIAKAWKWSSAERERAKFIAEHWPINERPAMDRWKEMLVDGRPMDWVADLMRVASVDPAVLADWPVPKMPVSGADLIKAGVKPGPAMGQMIRTMTQVWKDSDYTASKAELMAHVEMEVANDR